VEQYFAGLDLAECIARFEPADCCFTPVVGLAEAIESKHTQARGLVRRAPSGQLQALFPARVDGEVPASRTSMRDTNGGFGE
jgi:alpha-methylacyl-CoA racemase